MTKYAHSRHEANAYGKAQEAISAIEWLIFERFAGIDDRRSGLHEFRSFLFGEDEEMRQLYWDAVGMAHNMIVVKPGRKITKFDSSREFVLELLTAAIDEVDAPEISDPFAGLVE